MFDMLSNYKFGYFQQAVSDAAGAIADSYTLIRAKQKNKNPGLFLEENNSYEFFKSLNDLLFTGYTGTNVMDIQIIVKIG